MIKNSEKIKLNDIIKGNSLNRYIKYIKYIKFKIMKSTTKRIMINNYNIFLSL